MLLWFLMSCVFMQSEIAFGYNITFCTTFKCPDLRKLNIKCKLVENHIDCLRSIDKNEIQLGYATIFETIAASKLLPNLEVVGVHRDNINSLKWREEIVVVTNRPISNFEELKDFTYCNYGFGTSIPQFMIDGLEKAIFKRYNSPNCGIKRAFKEEQVCNLNEFFGPSCRGGQWVYDFELIIERSYPKLCELCPAGDCVSIYPTEKCLKLENGAVAVTTLRDVTSMRDSSFYYLCQNGTTSTEPYVWYKHPWPLIFTHKSLKQSITKKLDELVSICAFHGENGCLYNLGEVLSATSTASISALDENETDGLIPSLQPYDLDWSTNKNNKPIRWCTVSQLEYEKCNWLKVFSGILIYPIECILGNSKEWCIFLIEEMDAADMMEIVKHPIRGTLLPVAISKTPFALYKDTGSELERMCRDKFHYDNSILTFTTSAEPRDPAICPFGVSFRQICTHEKSDFSEVCYYHSEVIMRLDDPNRENAKVLLTSIISIFREESKVTRPFDFFGRFNGVSNLLLQSNTKDFHYLKFEVVDDSTFQTKLTEDDYEHSTIQVFTSTPNSTYENSTSSNWSTFGIIVAVAITVGLCLALFKYILRKNTSNGEYSQTRTDQH